MAQTLGYLAQVQRGIDYLEARLEQEVSLREVSLAAGMSHWHFQRIFKALTGETLKTYVRSRRLANALDRLLHTTTRILDIAIEAGFESQEAFTRAFKAAFGMTPGAFRKLGDNSLFLQKVRFDAQYLTHINQNLSLEPKLVDCGARRLVGLRTEFYGIDSDKNNIGSKLPALWERFMAQLPERAIGKICYGVLQQISADDDRLLYHAAVELPEAVPVPAGMSEVRLPSARYATFEHRGSAAQVDHTVNYIYSTWLAGSAYRHSYGADLEIYDSRYHPTSAESVFEYAIPVV